jgi:hypothetical protein
MSRKGRRKKANAGSGPAPRRVLLRRPAGADAFGIRTEANAPGNATAYAAAFRLADRYRAGYTHPVVRLTENGVDWGVEPQAGDEIGYAMAPHRHDDCFQAAVATVTQVPIEQVPDLALDRRLSEGADAEEISRTAWERFDAWATRRAFALRFWPEVPVDRPRWIGVVESPMGDARYSYTPDGGVVLVEGTNFNDHCLVMSHDRLLFDPSCSVRIPPGARPFAFTPDQITYGISFEEDNRHG